MSEAYAKRDLENPACVVDANHANSNKKFKEQIRIVNDILNSRNFVSQGNYGLCWAASVATVVNYKKNKNLTAKQVANVMGIGYNEGANNTQIKKALDYYGLSYKIKNSKLSWADVKSSINNDKPFLIGLENSQNAHEITGYGYGTCAKSYLNVVYAWDSNGAKISFLYNTDTILTSGYSFQWVDCLY